MRCDITYCIYYHRSTCSDTNNIHKGCPKQSEKDEAFKDNKPEEIISTMACGDPDKDIVKVVNAIFSVLTVDQRAAIRNMDLI